MPKEDYKHEGGLHILKNMSDDQLDRLSKELNLSLEELINKQSLGCTLNVSEDGKYLGSIRIDNSPFDAVCIASNVSTGNFSITADHAKCLKDPNLLVIPSPNPTSSSVSVKLLTCISQLWGHYKIFPLSVEFQLLFNERIIHNWINNNCSEIEIISDEYLQESGTYLLVCNFT